MEMRQFQVFWMAGWPRDGSRGSDVVAAGQRNAVTSLQPVPKRGGGSSTPSPALSPESPPGIPSPSQYSHWCWVMARARKAQKPSPERAEKKIPTQRKNLSPFNQVLQ